MKEGQIHEKKRYPSRGPKIVHSIPQFIPYFGHFYISPISLDLTPNSISPSILPFQSITILHSISIPYLILLFFISMYRFHPLIILKRVYTLKKKKITLLGWRLGILLNNNRKMLVCMTLAMSKLMWHCIDFCLCM